MLACRGRYLGKKRRMELAARRIDAIDNFRSGRGAFSHFLSKSLGRNTIDLHEVQTRLQSQLPGQGQIRVSAFDFRSVIADANKIETGSARGPHLFSSP